MTKNDLREAWLTARTRVQDAAEALAYDVTFRAEDPYRGQHQRPSAKLTADLKRRYRQAVAVERFAFDRWQAASEPVGVGTGGDRG